MANWEDALKRYDEIVSKLPHIERKGKTMPYTSANGYMFSLLNKEGDLGMRLPKDRQKEFIAKYNSGPFMSYGAVMKDYVIIPESLFAQPNILESTLQEAFLYVSSLPPK